MKKLAEHPEVKKLLAAGLDWGKILQIILAVLAAAGPFLQPRPAKPVK